MKLNLPILSTPSVGIAIGAATGFAAASSLLLTASFLPQAAKIAISTATRDNACSTNGGCHEDTHPRSARGGRIRLPPRQEDRHHAAARARQARGDRAGQARAAGHDGSEGEPEPRAVRDRKSG